MSEPTERPGVITFIGLLLGVQGVIAVVVGLTTLASRGDAQYQAMAGRTSDQLLVLGIGEIILAVLLVLAAFGVLRGSAGARTYVAAVMAVRIGFGIWTMLSHSGGLVAASALTVAVSMFVLWALFDRQESRAFFG